MPTKKEDNNVVSLSEQKKIKGDGGNVVMLGDNILVQREEKEEATAGGIYIPETSVQNKPGIVTVKVIPDSISEILGVSAGDKVLVSFYIYNNKSSYTDIIENGLFIKKDDIFAKIKE